MEPSHRATDGSYDTLFRVPVMMIDEEGRRWPLTYEGVTCRGQRHFRFTHGWRKFVSCRCIDVGEWRRACTCRHRPVVLSDLAWCCLTCLHLQAQACGAV